MSKDVFSRYASFIQEYIYRGGWEELREVQVEACEAIMDSDDHVLIASGTASGKTEAVFFPILTILNGSPSKSIGIMYISPLKALINDQFERLDKLLAEIDLPVWPWHDDVSRSTKMKVLKSPEGIIQITPESLEAMLMSSTGLVNKLFSDLKFIVIDEIHAFIGQDRGLQVMCLLSRLESIINRLPRRIGLSATLNDYELAKKWLAGDTTRDVQMVGLKHHSRKIALCVESFNVENPIDEEEIEKKIPDSMQFIYDNCSKKKCLIFTNSRGEAEKTISFMKKIASLSNEKDIFWVHHGSVSASLRKEAELSLRESKGSIVTAATLTLELGIDLGDLDLTAQLGSPRIISFRLTKKLKTFLLCLLKKRCPNAKINIRNISKGKVFVSLQHDCQKSLTPDLSIKSC